MLFHVVGTVTGIYINLVVVDCHGIGFALNASLNTIAAVRVGESSKLFIYESVREDAFDLFGFVNKEEKRCFEMLIGISGVGPKAAISILSTNTPTQLALAVLNGDIKALSNAPGIGKKIAQRIVLELKDKISKEAGGLDLGDAVPAAAAAPAADNPARQDAIAALAVRGYSMPEINGAMQKIQTDGLSTEQIVKAVLRQMMQ
jgi:Holliday junction DNA helicase RuvA